MPQKLRGERRQWLLDASSNREDHRPCSSVSQFGISGRPASTHLLFSSFKDCAPVLHIAHRTN